MLSVVVFGAIVAFGNQLLDEGKRRFVDFLFDKLYPVGFNMLEGFFSKSGCAMYLRERPLGKYIALRERDIGRLKKVFDSFEESDGL